MTEDVTELYIAIISPKWKGYFLILNSFVGETFPLNLLDFRLRMCSSTSILVVGPLKIQQRKTDTKIAAF